VEHARHKIPLFICVLLRPELYLSIHSINFKGLLAFAIRSPAERVSWSIGWLSRQMQVSPFRLQTNPSWHKGGMLAFFSEDS